MTKVSGRSAVAVLIMACGAASANASPESYDQSHTLGFTWQLRAESAVTPWNLQTARADWFTRQSGRALHGGRDAGSTHDNPCDYATAPWRVDGPAVSFTGSDTACYTSQDSVDPVGWYNNSNAPNLASSADFNFDPGLFSVWFGSVHGGPARINSGPSSYSMHLHNASGSAWNQPISPTQDLTCITASGPCPFYMDWANGKMSATESYYAAFGDSGGTPRNLTLDVDFTAAISIGTSISYGTLVGWRNDICPIPCPCTIDASCVGTPPKLALKTDMKVTVSVYKNPGNNAPCTFASSSLVSTTTYSGTLLSDSFSFSGTGEFAGIDCGGSRCPGRTEDTADLCDGHGQTVIGVHDTDSPNISTHRSIPITVSSPIIVVITRSISTTQQ